MREKTNLEFFNEKSENHCDKNYNFNQIYDHIIIAKKISI